MARIAFVVADDFEDREFRTPYEGLKAFGHQIDVLGVAAGQIVAGKKRTEKVRIEKAVADADPTSYDALVIPGGYSPDHLRTDASTVTFVSRMVKSGKLIAAVCHGPLLLIEADGVRGKTLTSWPPVRKELIDAGAHWVDQEVAIDGRLITSRSPADLEAFTRAIEQQLGARPEMDDRGERAHPAPRH